MSNKEDLIDEMWVAISDRNDVYVGLRDLAEAAAKIVWPRLAALEAENATLKEGDAERVRYITKVVEQRDSALAACAEKDAALRKIADPKTYTSHESASSYDRLILACEIARAALSDTCGQRYRDIVEGLRGAEKAGDVEHVLAAYRAVRRQALAAKEPTDA